VGGFFGQKGNGWNWGKGLGVISRSRTDATSGRRLTKDSLYRSRNRWYGGSQIITDGSGLINYRFGGSQIHSAIDQPTAIRVDCPTSTDGARGFDSDDLAASEPSVPGPVQPIFGQSPPTAVNFPADTHGAHGPLTTFTGQPFTFFPEDHDLPFLPVIVWDESTPTGVIPVSVDHSVPGHGSARPPADGQEVVFGTSLCGNCTASTDGALQTISPKSVIEPSVPGPVQAIFGQSPPAGGICPASTDDAQAFTPVPLVTLLATKTAHYVIGQPTPIGGDCPTSTDGARGFTSDDLAASELSIPGSG